MDPNIATDSQEAKEELCKFECHHEFDNICTIFKYGKEYCLKDFLQKVYRIPKPFVCVYCQRI